MLWYEKVKNMKGRMLGLLVVLSFAGITLVNVAIFGPGSLTSKLVRYLQTQTDENQLPLSDVGNEAETGIKQLSPINEANKEPETQSPPQQTDANETRKLEFSMLIGILKDLTSSSAKLEFIRDNMDLMPDSLSLVKLHRILALFSSVAKKLAVIQIFLAQLPDSLSLSELNHLLDQFSSTMVDDRITDTFE